ncbi:MAG TPA: DUF2141 domain-containing protein [Alphaproteobacteria bacterium]|jgi:uncharacterized protein (DUF2141 family)|nr:DUF2141 domain-containing protein [Alphaproteobacteria bacterium]
MTRIACLAILLGALLCRPVGAAAADLRVTVEGLRNDKGHVSFGLYDEPDKFPGRAGVIQGGRAKIEGGRAVFTFHDLTPGRYAVSLFHDENDDGKFDRSLIGLPLEGYGFSNNPKVVLSAPSFDDCAVTVGEAGAETTIKIAY